MTALHSPTGEADPGCQGSSDLPQRHETLARIAKRYNVCMKTFVVIPAQYGATYRFQAEKLASVGNIGVAFTDAQGETCAVVPLANVTVVYEEREKKA